MPKFSDYFGLRKRQPELDFVDVELDRDQTLFLDPFALSQRVDPWSVAAHDTLVDYFQRVLDSIRGGNQLAAQRLLSNLGEPNETRLGFSKGRPRGAGMGRRQAELLLKSLQDSGAVTTGFLQHLEDCDLMVDGVGQDKLSDLTTNVIREHLVEYTNDQCRLHGVPMQEVPLPPLYDRGSGSWCSKYGQLPVDGSDLSIMLVPKSVVRYNPAYDNRQYYNKYSLEFLQAEHLKKNTSLVETLKNGKKRVTKKAVKEIFRHTKRQLFEFSKDNPAVLASYRRDLERIERNRLEHELDAADSLTVSQALQRALPTIPPGRDAASAYHNLMIGVVEFIFAPHLVCPRKEHEIHEGRKRIDITMENGARSGVFFTLPTVRSMPCSYVAIECKNYSADPVNPELDQLSGRFSPLRGQVGILCCRTFTKRDLFLERCRDTLVDRRGLILPLDDAFVLESLKDIEQGRREGVEVRIRELVHKIWGSA